MAAQEGFRIGQKRSYRSRFSKLNSFYNRRSTTFNTPNANMADHSVVARDELHESEASQSLMFCFDNVSPGNSCFVVNLVPLFRLPYAFLC